MFIAALFITASNQKEPRCPSQVSGPATVHMDHGTDAIEGNELLTLETIWINRRGIMLSEKTTLKQAHTV